MTKALAITAGVLDALNLVISAWRYVLSATYRAQVQAHWQQTTESRKAAEMIGAVFCLAATQNAIAAFFTRAGFERLLSEAWYRAADNVAIFDTWSTNVLEFAGRLFPIDIVPLRPNEMMPERIRRALQVPYDLR